MANKIKKIKNSFKKAGKEEKDRVEALLEDINHNFKAFGEALESTRENLSNEIKDMRKEMDYKFEIVFGELGKINLTLDDIRHELKSIKSDISELKSALSKKADVDKLENLEQRVIVMEKYLLEIKSLA